MRRAGVDPWIATAAASLFLFLGAASQTVLDAANIGFVAALVFGLVHLLFADHDGPVDRRDWLGILFGFAGLLCSGVAVVMTIVVGSAMLVRRGWRIAMLHIAPLAAVFAAWWMAYGRGDGARNRSSELIAQFVAIEIVGTFDAMGQVPGVGVALGVLLVVGVMMAWHRFDLAEVRTRLAAPGALLVGALVFLVTTGLGRAYAGLEYAHAPRYFYVAAALSLPALAVAADTVARHHRLLAGGVLLVLLIGIPSNVQTLTEQDGQTDFRKLMLALPRLSLADTVPRSVRPAPEEARWVTIGWLLDGVAAGRVPGPGAIDPTTAEKARFRLSILQTKGPETHWGCRALVAPEERQFEKGESVSFRGKIQVFDMSGRGGETANSTIYDSYFGNTLVAVDGPLKVRLASASPFPRPVQLCGESPRK
jgi:hypothetical protein